MVCDTSFLCWHGFYNFHDWMDEYWKHSQIRSRSERPFRLLLLRMAIIMLLLANSLRMRT